MRIAIPTAEGQLAMHFGHCEVFTIFDVDLEKKEILETEEAVPPPHEPGVLPEWLAKLGVNAIVAGGMGMRAQQLFASRNIDVITGASAEKPEEIILDYMNNRLELGDNLCQH